MQLYSKLHGFMRMAVLIIMFGLGISAVPANANPVYLAVLNSGQETAKPDSNALGNALLTLDTETNMLCYSISFTDLDGVETAAHFHGPAGAGDDASPLFDITGGSGPSPVGSPKTGCVGPVTNEEKVWLRKSEIYINIHSDDFPGGEIRGQVIRQRANTDGTLE